MLLENSTLGAAFDKYISFFTENSLIVKSNILSLFGFQQDHTSNDRK